ncbi:MAG TPA: M48 family metallopeptidase [Sedimentisphaerales bacterium]|nr:M48 family metallopeptidase [Sedimentisphaerales bacterium]
MSGLFYNLGRKVGPKVRKARWMWQSLTGSEADAIKVEYEVGHDLAREIRQQLGHSQEPQTDQMLDEIGNRLADCVANKSRRFSFETVKGTEPNAFALPGGFIFVTQSLVELCRYDQNEIACILGHEMGHVIRGHAMNRIVSNSAIAAASRAAPLRGVLSGWLRKVGVQFLESAYSKDLESEADRLGVRLVAAAGYEPGACVQLFSRLAKLNSPPSQFDLGSYFSSHPPFKVRIENIKHQLRKYQQQAQP